MTADEREAAARLPLRWGGYRSRVLGGLGLVTGGGVLVAGSDTFQLALLGVGQLALTVGWAVVPAAGWRRIVVLVPASLGFWVLLGGPKLLPAAMLPYLGWLLVRHRPALAWTSALLPLAAIVLVMAVWPHGYASMLADLGVTAAAMVAGAWAAAGIDRLCRRTPGSLAGAADSLDGNPADPPADGV